VRPALEMAFASEQPAIVEAIVDPFEPPVPPRATAKQALHLAESIARGEPEGGKIIATILQGKIKEMV
jgi:pyruvate dehydrogenase (quinone)/pyruvate oxidase